MVCGSVIDTMDDEDDRWENGEDAAEDFRGDDVDGEDVRAWSGLTVVFASERKRY